MRKTLAVASLLVLLTACTAKDTARQGEIDAATAGRDAAQLSDAEPSGTPFAFVASASSNQIAVYRVDEQTGAFTAAHTSEAMGPTFLAYDPLHHTLYAAEESNNTVAAFAVGETGELSFLNRVSSRGGGPVHLTVDASHQKVLVANYGGGTAAVLPISADGQLGEAATEVSPGANAHQIVLDPSNRYAFVPSLGTDSLVQYLFDAAAGSLEENPVRELATANGAGPRHMSFSPVSDFAYLINERNNTMTAMRFDASTGTMSELHTLSTLPEGFAGQSFTAEVQAHPTEPFLYGSNRGHDSIVSYELASDGRMTLLAHTPSGGGHPRHFSIEPSGRFLFVANRDSDSVHGFRIDAATGLLTPIGTLASIERPQFVEVFYR